MSHVLKAMKAQQRAMAWSLLMTAAIVRKALRSTSTPDFPQLHRLMGYIERFVENKHQPNEERHLFRAAEARAPDLTRAVARLRRDHAAMKGYRIRLATALKYWEQGDPKAGPQAAVVVEDYLDFCRDHMRREQGELLPALHKLLSDSEWAGINDALAAVADPLTASRSKHDRMTALRSLSPEFSR